MRRDLRRLLLIVGSGIKRRFPCLLVENLGHPEPSGYAGTTPGDAPTGRHVVTDHRCGCNPSTRDGLGGRPGSMRAVTFFSVRDCHSQRAEGARLVADRRVGPISHVRQKRAHQFGILQ